MASTHCDYVADEREIEPGTFDIGSYDELLIVSHEQQLETVTRWVSLARQNVHDLYQHRQPKLHLVTFCNSLALSRWPSRYRGCICKRLREARVLPQRQKPKTSRKEKGNDMVSNVIQLKAVYDFLDAGNKERLVVDACADAQGLVGEMTASLIRAQAVLEFVDNEWMYGDHLGPFAAYSGFLQALAHGVQRAFAGNESRVVDGEFLSQLGAKNSYFKVRLEEPIDWELGKDELMGRFSGVRSHARFAWGSGSPDRGADSFSFWT